ncbi:MULTISPECIES: RnfABCDGE type electron transport complex subunit D [unclassified Paenibacillus]|uniref:RnfABCDGE type electron transport complex subunit D n=1 Tax=unclassified Paenibacillus TaxID=185978 RepID=UPI00363F1098
MRVNQWKHTPKGYVIISMVAFLLIATIWSLDIGGIYNAIIAVGVSSAVDYLCSRIAKRKRALPDSAVITGLIIALILSTTTSWYMVAAASIMAILSKHLLVYKKKPIFNPAAFGLLLSILFFRTGQSWWGAFGDIPVWTIVLLLIGGYMVTNRVNKFPQVFSFLGMYFILLLFMGLINIGDATDALRPPFINASLFFALFMLTDPPTSPAKYKDQVIFGILSAVVGVVIYGFYGGLMYLFIGLLAGNLYHLLKTRVPSRVLN